MEKITVLIADDHKLVRETWALAVSRFTHFEVVSLCRTAEEAIEEAGKWQPRLILLDISMPGLNGIDAIPLLRQLSPGSRILGVSAHSRPVYARKMIESGASGYLTKNTSAEEFYQALAEIGEGRTYICTEIAARDAENPFAGGELQPGSPVSKREQEIIELIRKGHTSQEIAGKLNIRKKTVEVHRYNILRKLQVKNTASLINYINENCMVHPVA